MELNKIKVGKRVSYSSRGYNGKGTVARINETARGVFVEVTAKDHPKGKVQVRASQIAAA
jgi:hypothetical protein